MNLSHLIAPQTQKGLTAKSCKSLMVLVGARGFEPPTPCSQSRYASQAALRPDIFYPLMGRMHFVNLVSLLVGQ